MSKKIIRKMYTSSEEDVSDVTPPVRMVTRTQVSSSDLPPDELERKTSNPVSPVNLSALPDSILNKIASYMNKSGIANTFGINPLMQSIRSRIDVELDDVQLTIDEFMNYSRELSKYNVVSLSIHDQEDNIIDIAEHKNVEYAAKLLKKIRSLEIDVHEVVSNTDNLRWIASNCINLLYLTCDGSCFNAMTEDLPHREKIVKLDTYNTDLISLEGYINVKNLSLKNIDEVNFDGIDNVIDLYLVGVGDILDYKYMTGIQVLKLKNCAIKPRWINSQTALQELEMVKCSGKRVKIDNATVENIFLNGMDVEEYSITNCENLTTLKIDNITSGGDNVNIFNCPKLSTLYIDSVSNTQFLMNCPDIKELELILTTNLSNNIKYCTKLESLILGGASITDASFLSRCGKLKYLIMSCNILTDIDMFFPYLSELEKLIFSGDEITSIENIKFCTKLQKVDIQSKNIDYSSICNLPELKSLSIIDNNMILTRLLPTTLISLSIMGNMENLSCIKNCVNLEWLSLSDSSTLSNLNGIENCAKLHGITIENMRDISSINSLRYCKNLRYVEMQNLGQRIDISPLKYCPFLSSVKTRNCRVILGNAEFSNSKSYALFDVR